MKDLQRPDQFPSEFMSDGDIYEIFMKYGLAHGRMISGSKSGYMGENPTHQVYFNGNIIIESRGKIWYGDLDVTKDREILEKIAKELKEPLYILYEHDARFENEDQSIEFYKNRAKVKIEP